MCCAKAGDYVTGYAFCSRLRIRRRFTFTLAASLIPKGALRWRLLGTLRGSAALMNFQKFRHCRRGRHGGTGDGVVFGIFENSVFYFSGS